MEHLLLRGGVCMEVYKDYEEFKPKKLNMKNVWLIEIECCIIRIMLRLGLSAYIGWAVYERFGIHLGIIGGLIGGWQIFKMIFESMYTADEEYEPKDRIVMTLFSDVKGCIVAINKLRHTKQ